MSTVQSDPTTRAPISPVGDAWRTVVAGIIGNLAARVAALGFPIGEGEQLALVVIVMAGFSALGNTARNRGWWIGSVL